MVKRWVKFFESQSSIDKLVIALAAIERLIEIGEVKFRMDDSVNIDGSEIPDEEVVEECLYWEATGESLVIPF